MRLPLQPTPFGPPSAVKTRTPFFFIFTTRLTTPLALEGFVTTLIPAPLIRTRKPAAALLPCLRKTVSVVLRPTISWPGVIRLTATQGGVMISWVISTVAVAVLLATLVSGRLPDTTAVLVWVPGELGVVTRVIVTVSPAAIGPMSQFRIAPPVQVPFVVVEDTYVFPAGIGSEIFTPVSLLGPLFVTTIVHVMFPVCRIWVAGEPDFVIARSTRALTHVEALDWSLPSLLVVTWPVLSTTPVVGQSPPVAPVVPEVMCTVNVDAACVVPAGTVTGPQDRTPAAIEQVEPNPAPVWSIDHDRPGLIGRTSVS